MLLNLTPELLIANLIALGLGMTIHEFAHNYIAWRMGDPEPARLGRLTLNPLVHINWLGWIMFAVLGFGILGSAPISPYRMPLDNRRWRWLAAVAAGPVSNLLLATVFALIVRIIGFQTLLGLPDILVTILDRIIFLNILLFVFNHNAARATGKVSLRVAGSGYVATDLAADAAVPVSSGNGVVRLDVSLDAQDVRVFRLSQAAVR